MPDPRPLHARILAPLLGMAVPCMLVAALWAWDWRWVVTALIAGITAGAFMPQRKKQPPWPAREDL